MLTLPIVTERLHIDRLGSDDAPILAAYRGDPEVARWQSWDVPYGLDRAEAVIVADGADTPGEPGSGVNLALRLREVSHDAPAGVGPVGDVYLAVLAVAPDVCELGITLARPHQHRGLATEAVTAVLDAVFDGTPVARATAYVDARNGPSLALFDRLAFRRDALLRGSHRDADGSPADEVRFVIGAAEWRRTRTAAHTLPAPAGPDDGGRRHGVDEERH